MSLYKLQKRDSMDKENIEMRLWSIHPKYLDSKGLVACWRESLLAQAVLRNETIGYKNHSQLIRFKAHPDPKAAILSYLQGLKNESIERGYNFKEIDPPRKVDCIPVSAGQLIFEMQWIYKKLVYRNDRERMHLVKSILTKGYRNIEMHPLFTIKEIKEVESWEKNILK